MKRIGVNILVVAGLVIMIAQLFLQYQSVDDDETRYPAEFKKEYRVYAVPLPKEVYFAEEKVPLDYFDVKESLDRELLINVYWQSQTLLAIKRAAKYFPIIEPILKKNNIPNDFKYLAVIESGLTNAVSGAGAVGFWQFLKTTGTEYGLEITEEVDERYHLEKSTEAACRYFKKSYEKYGNWSIVAASYNAGSWGMQKQLDRQLETNYYDLLFGEETGRYVFRILAMKLILENPDKYGFVYRKKDLYAFPEYNKVLLDSSVTDFAMYAKHFKTNYKILKTLNPWLRDIKLTVPKGKTYEILIPDSRSI